MGKWRLYFGTKRQETSRSFCARRGLFRPRYTIFSVEGWSVKGFRTMMACFCLGIPIGVLFNRIIAVRGADESMRKRTCIAGYGVVSLGCFLVGYTMPGMLRGID